MISQAGKQSHENVPNELTAQTSKADTFEVKTAQSFEDVLACSLYIASSAVKVFT
jgi:hypothetical protein